VTPRIDFLWVGNHPATDLCNTQPVIDGEPVELLPDFGSIRRWLSHSGIEIRADISALGADDERRTVQFVHRLRASLRTILEPPQATRPALGALNEVLAGTRGSYTVTDDLHLAVVAGSPGAQLRLDLASAVCDIFRHDLTRVRRCARPACVLLFLDVSKSGRRRWCDMGTCGNRAKAARHYERNR
jgi:predicted RNA-binding Zn ribbon-like protein